MASQRKRNTCWKCKHRAFKSSKMEQWKARLERHFEVSVFVQVGLQRLCMRYLVCAGRCAEAMHEIPGLCRQATHLIPAYPSTEAKQQLEFSSLDWHADCTSSSPLRQAVMYTVVGDTLLKAPPVAWNPCALFYASMAKFYVLYQPNLKAAKGLSAVAQPLEDRESRSRSSLIRRTVTLSSHPPLQPRRRQVPEEDLRFHQPDEKEIDNLF